MDPPSLLAQAQAHYPSNGSGPSPSAYNFAAMWSFSQMNGGRRDVGSENHGFLGGLEMNHHNQQGRSQFGDNLVSGFVEGGGSNRDMSVDDSTVTTDQSGAEDLLCKNQMEKKRRDGGEDEPSKAVSTSSSPTNSRSLSNGKRPKAPGRKNENGDTKGEPEESTKAGNKQSAQLTEPPKDYIHVRARRGQATDSHSLAERARREKISERMKILQDLVPGCNKVIGKALVLDEIINYIQSLQRQVEFLSMKLEAVTSRITPSIEAFTTKDNYEPAPVAFTSEASRDYCSGSPQEWLHMQVGGGFERGT